MTKDEAKIAKIIELFPEVVKALEKACIKLGKASDSFTREEWQECIDIALVCNKAKERWKEIEVLAKRPK